MTSEQFSAEMSAAAPHLSPEQRRLVCQFAATLADHVGAELAKVGRDRRQLEREFEERQLAEAGDEAALERRRREPA